MKVSKALLCRHGALISALNLAIGRSGLKLWDFISEVGNVVEPFEKFRNKIASDYGIGEGTLPDDPKIIEAEKQLNEFAKGDVEIQNVHFLSEDEFKKAAEPLFSSPYPLSMHSIELLKELLCEKKSK